VGLSRNKVAVGESAAGSPPNANAQTRSGRTAGQKPKNCQYKRIDDSKTTGPTDVKRRSSPLATYVGGLHIFIKKGS
jgi:hypothetical protein